MWRDFEGALPWVDRAYFLEIGDVWLPKIRGRFFDPFLFEELPAKDVSAQQAYLTEVADTEVYLGLFGVDYGYEDAEGVSPTEREYDCATENHKYR